MLSANSATVSPNRLWLGLALAPAAWLGGELLGYYVTARGCETAPIGVPLPSTSHPATAVVVIEILAAILAATGLVIALRSWRNTQVDGDANEPPSAGRRHFMAFTGAVTSAVFLLGIIWLGFPALVVNACSEIR
jgi:hypothetical protein